MNRLSEERDAFIYRVLEKIRERRKAFFCPEDGGDKFFRNVCSYKTHTVPHPRRGHSTLSNLSFINQYTILRSIARRIENMSLNKPKINQTQSFVSVCAQG
jgi:hypothetical protein